METKLTGVSAYFTVSTDPHLVGFNFQLGRSLTLGSISRAKELRRRVKARIQKWSPTSLTSEQTGISAVWHRSNFKNFRLAMEEIEQVVDDFCKERLEPKVVEEILGISSQERRRWVKDGRLPRSGTGQFKKGKQVFQFFLHPADEIAKLAAHLEIIESWREADRLDPN